MPGASCSIPDYCLYSLNVHSRLPKHHAVLMTSTGYSYVLLTSSNRIFTWRQIQIQDCWRHWAMANSLSALPCDSVDCQKQCSTYKEILGKSISQMEEVKRSSKPFSRLVLLPLSSDRSRGIPKPLLFQGAKGLGWLWDLRASCGDMIIVNLTFALPKSLNPIVTSLTNLLPRNQSLPCPCLAKDITAQSSVWSLGGRFLGLGHHQYVGVTLTAAKIWHLVHLELSHMLFNISRPTMPLLLAQG